MSTIPISPDTTHQVNIDGAHMVVTHGRDVGLPEPITATAGRDGHVVVEVEHADAPRWLDHAGAEPGRLLTVSQHDGARSMFARGSVMGVRVSIHWSEAVEVAR